MYVSFLLLKITKYVSGKYEFRTSISLLDVQAIQFSTQSKRNYFFFALIFGGQNLSLSLSLSFSCRL